MARGCRVQFVEEFEGDALDHRPHRLDPLAAERRLDHAAEAGVVGRIAAEHMGDLGAQVDALDPAVGQGLGAPHILREAVVGECGPDIGVAGDDPQP